jgi:hypothetical protein
MLDTVPTEQAINDIVRLSERIRGLWSDGGWAPPDGARLLRQARLDRLVSLSHALRLWLDEAAGDDAEGRLILAWANLGTLVEGTMKWFLCVYECHYALGRVVTEGGRELDPDELRFLRLCQFFRDHVWDPRGTDGWYSWCDKVRRRRNAVHAYEDRDLGTWDKFHRDIQRYRDLLQELEAGVPDPPDEPR